MTAAEEIVDIVDEADAVIGQASVRAARAANLLRRGVAAIIRDRRGGIYVHRRADTRDAFPGRYDMFVAGNVSSGESYGHAIRRELAEELGIDGVEPAFLFKFRYRDLGVNWWTCVYDLVWEGPIQHQEEEIAWGAFIPESDLTAKLDEWPFIPGGLPLFRRYLDERWR